MPLYNIYNKIGTRKRSIVKPVIFISGSSRGIGAATARLAKAKEMTDILHGSKQSEQKDELAQELDDLAVTADITDAKDVKEAIGKVIEGYERIEGIDNCAA